MNTSLLRQVSFTSNPQLNTNEQRKQKQEQVATGVGGTAAATTAATKYAGRKGLKAQAGEQFLGEMSTQVANGIKTANRVQETATGFIATFKQNFKMYTASIMENINKFKNSKLIGPIIKSPMTKRVSALAGGALAFFVLVTGVNKAFKTGEIAVEDFKSKYNDFRNAA